jgi:hypothetical protein
MSDTSRDREWQPYADALRSLPRRAVLPQAVLADLKHVAASPRPRPVARTAAVVAGLAATLFVGVALGRVTAPVSPQTAPDTPTGAAIEVQRAGTAYAGALRDLATIDADGSEKSAALAQGREAALATLHASALAYQALANDDPGAGDIAAAIVAARQRLPAGTTWPLKRM